MHTHEGPRGIRVSPLPTGSQPQLTGCLFLRHRPSDAPCHPARDSSPGPAHHSRAFSLRQPRCRRTGQSSRDLLPQDASSSPTPLTLIMAHRPGPHWCLGFSLMPPPEVATWTQSALCWLGRGGKGTMMSQIITALIECSMSGKVLLGLPQQRSRNRCASAFGIRTTV